MAEIVKLEELAGMAGRELEPTDWLEIDQDRVNQFAVATNDHQFIHVDPDKAAQTPFGGTIAHGYLSMSLVSFFNEQSGVLPEGLEMAVNYGSDKVRYLAPVRVGKRVRARMKILEIDEKRPGQWLMKTAVTIEIEGETAPAMIAEVLGLYIVK